jgi:hypothetical protein
MTVSTSFATELSKSNTHQRLDDFGARSEVKDKLKNECTFLSRNIFDDEDELDVILLDENHLN